MSRLRAGWLACLAAPAFVACILFPAGAAEDPWEEYRPIELVCPEQAEPRLVLTSQSKLDIGVRDRVTLLLADGEVLSVTLEGAAAGYGFEEIFAGSPSDTDATAAGNARRVVKILEPYLAACSEGGDALLEIQQTLKRNRQELGLD